MTTTTERAKYVEMYEIARRHLGHWFDPGSLRFFRSRLAQGGYRTADRARVYFVSSEQFEDSTGWRAPRLYSVRVMDWDTGDIDTVGEFQQYASRSGADRAARREAGYR